MTLQEVFDKVLFGLREQGEASLAYGRCAYRGECGRKCAAGMLIDDERYTPNMEYRGVPSPEVWSALVASGVPNATFMKGFVIELQRLHDTYLQHFGLQEWERQMRQLAQWEGIKYTPAQA